MSHGEWEAEKQLNYWVQIDLESRSQGIGHLRAPNPPVVFTRLYSCLTGRWWSVDFVAGWMAWLADCVDTYLLWHFICLYYVIKAETCSLLLSS